MSTGKPKYICSAWFAIHRVLRYDESNNEKALLSGGGKMSERVFQYPFDKIYQLYLQKVTKKGRTQAELDNVLSWLTGYEQEILHASELPLQDFFAQAKMSPQATLITGVVCGVRVEKLEDPLMRQIREMDKVVDELAKGKAIEKIKR
ncbi:hypothetical protein FD01_GL000052 [Lacticaseibacillus manihotivorans DSM 13343 = JCM 12514]|jgi:hypothetical protein|uniref:DUF2200 domain-containing protein n=2 Tax=Lacticaseibacillus manihotivorans TaxID=88233 RepID=A0A0R1RAK2_9LACO|nr:hypothetical protein FD01_GL000052 [Lacticaseibacillus manihotivorans DSM 13343 = JCM 12514]